MPLRIRVMTRPLRSHVAETVAETGGAQVSGRLPGHCAFAGGLGLLVGLLWGIVAGQVQDGQLSFALVRDGLPGSSPKAFTVEIFPRFGPFSAQIVGISRQ